MTPRRLRRALVAGGAVAAMIAVPAAVGAAPAPQQPGQKVDMKVLLLSSNPDDAWKAMLAREGVPYDYVQTTGTTTVVTDAQLADYATNHAKYQAVIAATPMSDGDEAAVAKLERTFGIRQVSDNTFPSAAHGLNAPTQSGPQDGVVATLTAAGKQAFPYLKGNVPIANLDPAVDEAYGYRATPVNAQDFTTLLSGPAASSLLGVYTHPDDGREEMVMTVASNATQSHNQLLRHGMINWVTRGVFLGIQRNYLELQVDDLFLGDDTWDMATNVTDQDPAKAIRMTAADLQQAVSWSKSRGVRLDMAFNGAGSDAAAAASPTRTDGLLTAAQANKSAFGWINHTFEHPNLDCSTRSFIANQVTRNVAWATSHGLAGLVDPGELVTGEHSGLANTRPGNPGTIDPPQFDDAATLNATGGTLAPGTYIYGITATSPHGETVPSTVDMTVAAPAAGATTSDNAVSVSWEAVCHATSYKLYRSPTGAAGTWSLITTVTPTTTATDTGTAPVTLSFTDTGAAGTLQDPPAVNGAALDPYAQNPATIGALTDAKVTSVATDSSKAYPDPTVAGNIASTYVAGKQFTDGPARTIPRYPTNVYYNAGTREQQLDEYNWLYVAPANGGGCVPITDVTTCRTAAATWAEYLASEANIMFGHVMGDDPRPHYFHQSNLALWQPALGDNDTAKQGGIMYAVADALLARYNDAFNSTMPLVQLGQTQIGAEIARQDKWAADVAAGRVSAYLQDGRVHVATTADLEVPLTGTTVGTSYGAQTSGWTTVRAGQDAVFTPSDPASAKAPAVAGTAYVGQRLTADAGTWTGTAPITHAYQWQRCDAAGAACTSVAGATAPTFDLTAADKGTRLRVVVSASNWISAVSQEASAPTAVVTDAPVAAPTPAVTPEPTPDASQPTGSGPDTTPGQPLVVSTPPAPSKLTLKKLRIAPRRFAAVKTRRHRKVGARITWTTNRAATVTLTVKRVASRAKRVGTLTAVAGQGAGGLKLTGRIGHTVLRPGRYRVSAVATDATGGRSAARTVTFTVVKG